MRRYYAPGSGGSSVGLLIIAFGLLVLVVGIAVAVAFGPEVDGEGAKKPPDRPIATGSTRRVDVTVSSDADLRSALLTIEITRSGTMWPDGGGTELIDMKRLPLPYEESYTYDASGSGFMTVRATLIVEAYRGPQSMGCAIFDPDTPRGISAADASDPLAPVGRRATWEAFCKGTYTNGGWLKQ